jgi:succinoglycan biosynthesis transport protein ExoP
LLEEDDGRASRSLNDYWAIVRRRRWYILLPLFLCWALAWAGSWLIPSTFQSEALILVEQQKVPEQYVVPNVSVSLQERLQSMTQQILSRTRLQATINRLHLYQAHHRSLFGGTGNSVEQMRKNIKIDLVEAPDRPGQLTAFKIRFSAVTPQLAQRVNRELTSLFIEENLKSEQRLSESTTAFLQSQLAAARASLDQQEAKIQDFKSKHLGSLPGQVETNVQILGGLQAQLQATQQGLDGANQQKLYLQSLLQQYQSIQAGLDNGDSSATSKDALDKQLLDLRRKLQHARLRYTEDYPDVIELKREIARTEKLKQETDSKVMPKEQSDSANRDLDLGAVTDVQHGAVTPMMQVQSQLKANRLEIQNYQQQAKKIEAEIAAYQARLNLTPETEQELADISRGYGEAKSNYDSLLQKQSASQLATSLQQQQQGEQFSVLDPPSLPTRPSAPNHLLISLAGLLFGVAIGVGLTALLELTDIRIRQEKDLEDVLPISVLIGIPHLDVPGEDRSRIRLRRLELFAVVVIAILIFMGNLYALYKG